MMRQAPQITDEVQRNYDDKPTNNLNTVTQWYYDYLSSLL